MARKLFVFVFVSDIFGNDWLQLVEQRVDMERKFLDFSLPGSECSTERKFHGSESSLYGLFAPRNESAEASYLFTHR